MKRRDFLHSGVIAGAAATVGAPAIAQSRRVLTIIGPTPESRWPSGLTKAGNAVRLYEWIERATDGEIGFEFYDGMDDIPEDGEYEYVMDGVVDGYFESEYHLWDYHRGFRVFGAMPMGMMEEEHTAWVYHGGGAALWDELSGQFGLKAVLAANIGMQAIGWFTKEIESPDDIAGSTMHMPGFAGTVMRSFGAETEDFPNAVLLDGLADGTLLGVEKSSPWVDLNYGFHSVAKYYYMWICHEPQNAVVLGFNRSVWDSLSARHRRIIEEVCMAHYAYSVAESKAKNTLALKAFREEHGERAVCHVDRRQREIRRARRDGPGRTGGNSRRGAR